MPLDAKLEPLLQQMSAVQIPLDQVTPAMLREQYVAMRAIDSEPEEVAKVEDVTVAGPAGDIPVRIYTPGVARGVLVYLHGGGWVIGSIETHDARVRAIANAAGCVVASVDYRLAPEAKFPAAVEDSYAATLWAAQKLGSPLAVGGDSAGGNLAAVVAQMAREKGAPSISAQILIYPVTNHAYDTPSYAENGEGYFLGRDTMEWFWNHYLRSADDGANPLASPARASDLSGLPPAVVITAEFDPLRDEGEAYAAALQAAGVPVVVKRYDGMIHGFFQMAGILDQATDALGIVATELKRAFA
jgi:acetyl esterase